MWRQGGGFRIFFFPSGFLTYSESNKMSIHKSFSVYVFFTRHYTHTYICVLVLYGCSCWEAVVVHIKNSLTLCLSLRLFLSLTLSQSLLSLLLTLSLSLSHSLYPSSQTSIPTPLSGVGRVARSSAATLRAYSPVQKVQFTGISDVSPARTLT